MHAGLLSLFLFLSLGITLCSTQELKDYSEVDYEVGPFILKAIHSPRPEEILAGQNCSLLLQLFPLSELNITIDAIYLLFFRISLRSSHFLLHSSSISPSSLKPCQIASEHHHDEETTQIECQYENLDLIFFSDLLPWINISLLYGIDSFWNSSLQPLDIQYSLIYNISLENVNYSSGDNDSFVILITGGSGPSDNNDEDVMISGEGDGDGIVEGSEGGEDDLMWILVGSIVGVVLVAVVIVFVAALVVVWWRSRRLRKIRGASAGSVAV